LGGTDITLYSSLLIWGKSAFMHCDAAQRIYLVPTADAHELAGGCNIRWSVN
jgi:hypothetical protein